MYTLFEKKGIIPVAMALTVIAMMGQQSLGWSSRTAAGVMLLAFALVTGSILAKKRKSEQP